MIMIIKTKRYTNGCPFYSKKNAGNSVFHQSTAALAK